MTLQQQAVLCVYVRMGIESRVLQMPIAETLEVALEGELNRAIHSFT